MVDLKQNSPLFGSNAPFLEELYNKYAQDPASVDKSWQDYFKSFNESSEIVKSAFTAAPWSPRKNWIIGYHDKHVAPANQLNVDQSSILRTVAAAHLIEAYRNYGHTYIKYDPLGLTEPSKIRELDPAYYGLKPEDMEKTVNFGFEAASTTIAHLISFLSEKYASRIGAEFMHLESHDERQWWQQQLEENREMGFGLTNEEKKQALIDLMEAEMFENYLHTKFPGTKRFSIEGGEGAITAMEYVIKESVAYGVEECVLGMAHRGRLNTLTKVMGKPYHAMLSEFKGELAFPDYMEIPGDVKYHLGTSNDRNVGGKKVHLSLTPNPSHLEVVNSIVLGKVRAKQDQMNDKERSKVLGILVHGDAAFAGQGSVVESLSLSQLKGYHTGGTIHIVINNQIGFTTNPVDARSTRYCTDVMKIICAPILHVNGDDAEAILFASKLAAEYRAKFKKDIALDIICYRKYGHNEGDEPFFTQPKMYAAISKHSTPSDVYYSKLNIEHIISEAEYTELRAKFKSKLDKEYELSQNYKPSQADWLQGKWGGLEQADVKREHEKTGVKASTLKKLGAHLTEYPKDFNINQKIERQLQLKKKMIETGKEIDWGTGEALAFASLLKDGFNVRMTGQDVKRGTFSHRHAVWFDQENEKEYIALNNLYEGQKNFLEIHNSNLSEFAVLSFEYGYSFTEPKSLTIWEAQFGDFANGAQVVIDQYIASGEAKWLRMNGLVLLLPHSYEGQGPEHSSARLERFLQLCAKDNMQVVNCSTPASYFHALRRQLMRNFRKPLIVMSPKSLLRHKLCISTLKEMDEHTTFKPVLSEVDELVSENKINRVILCSGKVYYDLYERRKELNIKDTAILRLEQFYPFPKFDLADELAKYKNADIIWCQEEHENMGAFYFVEPRIEKVLLNIKHNCKRARYVGRMRSASPAAGYMKLHQVEQKKLLDEALQ